jgi:O-antigen ligase
MKIFFLPIAIVFIFFTRSIIQRTFDLESDGLNLSGRDYAWAFLIESFDNVNYFGRGLGSITEALIYETSNNLSAFVAPHNEYIRFWYDLGYFGAVIFFFIIIKIINNSFKSSPTNLLIVKWPLLITVCFFCFVDNVFSTHHSYLPLALILVFFMNIESNKNV